MAAEVKVLANLSDEGKGNWLTTETEVKVSG